MGNKGCWQMPKSGKRSSEWKVSICRMRSLWNAMDIGGCWNLDFSNLGASIKKFSFVSSTWAYSGSCKANMSQSRVHLGDAIAFACRAVSRRFVSRTPGHLCGSPQRRGGGYGPVALSHLEDLEVYSILFNFIHLFQFEGNQTSAHWHSVVSCSIYIYIYRLGRNVIWRVQAYEIHFSHVFTFVWLSWRFWLSWLRGYAAMRARRLSRQWCHPPLGRKCWSMARSSRDFGGSLLQMLGIEGIWMTLDVFGRYLNDLFAASCWILGLLDSWTYYEIYWDLGIRLVLLGLCCWKVLWDSSCPWAPQNCFKMGLARAGEI